MSQTTAPRQAALPAAPAVPRVPPGAGGPAPVAADVTPAPAGRGRLAALLERAEAALAGSPGRLRVAAAVAILAALAVGLGGAQAASVRSGALADARATTAHLVLLQNARTALVQADADATNSALALYAGTLEPPAARAEYVAAISTASRAVAQAAGDGTAGDAAELSAVNDAITRYTGTIESGRTLNRLNNPTGVYYFKSASGELRADVLPRLATLVGDDEVRVAADYDRAVNARLWLAGLGVGGLVVLLAVQVRLARQTRRFLNLPLAGATAGLAVLLLATTVLMVSAQGRATDVRNGPYARTVALAQARVFAFDARSQLSLTLLSQGSGQSYQNAYSAAVEQAKRTLPKDQTSAAGALTAFAAASTRTLDTANNGNDWPAAFSAAVRTGTGSANAQFAAFEQATSASLARAGAAATSGLDDARGPLALVAWLMVLAAVVGAGFAWWGVSLRLDEYR